MASASALCFQFVRAAALPAAFFAAKSTRPFARGGKGQSGYVGYGVAN